MKVPVLLPCPFCGRPADNLDLVDTVYPSATYWREEDGLRHYVSHSDRRPTDGVCYEVNCPEECGGCGAQIHGDSKFEAMAAWNRRAAQAAAK